MCVYVSVCVVCVSVLLSVSAFVLGRAPQRVHLEGLVGEGISALK